MAKGEVIVSPAKKKAANAALRQIEKANDKFRSSIKNIQHPKIHKAHEQLDLKVKALRTTVDGSRFTGEEPSAG